MAVTASQVSQLQVNFDVLVEEWNKVKPIVSGWFINQGALSTAFKFLADGIDRLVNLAAQFNLPGADKKVLVLEYAKKLAKLVVGPFLPVWIPTAIVNAVIDAVLEFAVSKLPDVTTPVVPA